MITRYSRPKMANLWSEESQFRTWLDIEILACEGWAKIGKIPPKALGEIHQRANFDLQEVLDLEKVTKHDVAAFVSVLQKQIGDAGRYIHLGLTSSDILDTTFSLRLKKSCELLLSELENCLEITKQRAVRDKYIAMIGRTHGIHAEPITMGCKWLYWYSLLKRSKSRLLEAKREISVGKMSGAVGNYAHIPPEVEIYVCSKLGLCPDTLSSQIVSRDRYAAYFSALALLGSAMENIAVELRHLQRTEVGEICEGFEKGQKGSSAMPHKRNPISAENLTGCARLLRSFLWPALENCSLWHERDISHSSVERMIGPDANIVADYMLGRLTTLLLNLEVDPKRMQENMGLLRGVIYSQTVLLSLVERGTSRDEAYEIIQQNAMRSLDEKMLFLDLLKKDPRVTKTLPENELNMLFQPQRYFQHLDYLYKKVLEDESG